ncbi:protein FAF-like, chloroplastic [Abrus precatorius]|uniref:Protein FAF-like, chloroplastic n=1 Tax=Abrus precatorius TaxID=3816 RepID=A0A8B8KI44_ABRPR|nr:protein FAF-like, chloroplastic [Abrus precatorius]
MSTCMSKRIEEESMVMQKQGIVTILVSNYDVAPTSLRRTLSADMSSKTWLSQNGLSPMKKTVSSEELSHSQSLQKLTVAADSSSSSEGEDEYEEMKRERFQIWQEPEQFDMWSSILSHKEETSKVTTTTTTTPYVHPLVRRSKSCLSEKSLEICTESLGSETGSDAFSSYPPSETGDSEEEEEEVTVHSTHEEEFLVPKYNYAAKKSLPRCFPPPLSSLSPQHGPSLHMQSHRDNGRLFLQAVCVPSHKNFCAQRQDGRLILTFSRNPNEEEEEKDVAEELEEEFDHEAEQVERGMKQATILSSGISNVHRLALMMNKPIGLVNTSWSQRWSEKFNDVTNFKDVNVVQHSPLPPRPRARLIHSSPASGSFNAYEYYWRTKPKAQATSVPSPFTIHQKNYSSLENHSNQTSNDQQELRVLRGKKGDYLVHNLKNCKDSRRSFLFWEPYCIAT